MKPTRNMPSLEWQIRDLIGDDLAFLFFNAFGGRRLHMATEANLATKVAGVVGQEAADQLAVEFGRDKLRVPLAREFRCEVYRHHGLSNGEIATKLGVTESAINKMVDRQVMPPKGTARCEDGALP